MTRDRKHKKEAHAHQAERGGTYLDARLATAKAGSYSRRRSVVMNLATDSETLAAELSRFCGLRTPSGPLGAELVDATLAFLDSAPVRPPLGPRWGEISRTLEGIETVDPVPESIREVASSIAQQLSSLDDRQLVTAATELGVREGYVQLGVRHVINRSSRAEERARFADDGHDVPLPIVGDAEDLREQADLERERAEAIRRLRSLTGWRSRDKDVLRFAIARHLATLGEGYLTLSEERLKPLSWRRLSDGTLRADVPIHGAPQPLSAVIKEGVRNSWLDESSSCEFYQPARRNGVGGFVCRVGVFYSEPDEFDMYNVESSPSVRAAQLEGARMVGQIARDPGRIRSIYTRRLLVPRTAETSDDQDMLTFGVGDILHAIFGAYNLDDDDPEDWLWAVRPHVVEGVEGSRCNSVTALALDTSGCPLPRRDDVAFNQPVGSTAFQHFLATQGVSMTAIAKCYLVGTDDAGPGGQFLVDRHAAGMVAVFAAHQVGDVVAELAEEYSDLVDWSGATSPDLIIETLSNLVVFGSLLGELDGPAVVAEPSSDEWDDYGDIGPQDGT